MGLATIIDYINKFRDKTTNAVTTVDYAHKETHSGSRYYVQYGVTSLGAMTGDIISLNFTTDDSDKWDHFVFTAAGSSGFRVRLIEAYTGGGASATGTKPILNKCRNHQISKPAKTGAVSYDATLATGGTTLWDEFIPGSTSLVVGSGTSGKRDEIILKQNTKYQLSIYGTATEAALLYIDWYEHTNK